MKTMIGLMMITLAMPLTAFDPEDFAQVWELEADAEAGVARVRLTAEIHAIATDPDLTDLLITDASDQTVPFALLAARDLIEPLAQRESLEFSDFTAAHDDPDTSPALSPLRLEFMHDGHRLTLSIPRGQPDTETRRPPVLEALIGAVSVSDELPSQQLKLQLKSMEATTLDCRIRDADRLDEREQPIHLIDEGQRHPYRYTTTFPVSTIPRAWQLRCFAETHPEGLKLEQAWLLAQGLRNHRQVHRFSPETTARESVLQIELPGAYRVRSVQFFTEESNVLADVTVLARNQTDQPFMKLGSGILSTLPGDDRDGMEVGFQHRHRHRFWEVRIAPQPVRPVATEFAAEVEEIFFLPQGQGPWRLYAGSRRHETQPANRTLIERTLERLGPAWQWPLAGIQGPSDTGGDSALQPSSEPLPWRQIVLWLVLGLAALILLGLSAHLLRSG